ncbi:MAG: carbon monoxide dehydrogenase [Rhodospirillaceae bacterium]|nr:carbon monoxide dehydrogenase [Rhodospirillaceae bacterium]
MSELREKTGGQAAEGWVGRAVPRKEDQALLTGQARFIDDLEPITGLKHAAILRSPYAHAKIIKIDVGRAEALAGVTGVVTGAEVADSTKPIPSVVRVPMTCYPIAVEKVRYVGEPVAVVVAEDRYTAEDALELIDVAYEELPVIADPKRALDPQGTPLHDEIGSNVANRRRIVSGDPDKAFENAAHVVELDYRFPKYGSTPMETFGIIAHHQTAPERFTCWSNFQGPFVLQPLMSVALGVPGNRLRLITPPASGGSFGVKQGVFPYIVLLCAVSKRLGVPVKWIEDRLEHLMASTSANDRLGGVKAAFDETGELTGLRFKHVCNVGAYIRAPEPASVYRMQATSNGCYRVKNIDTEIVLVVTNQMPTGLNRGFGGPQFYFALERIMDLAAKELDIDPAELRKRNFVRAKEFPYDCPGGSILDSGDFERGLAEAQKLARYEELLLKRDTARAEGRYFGIGLACGVEPSGSNMGYVSLAQTVEERSGSDPKSGGNTSASMSMDPTGAVTVHLCSTPNGQGHATVAAQIVADALGIEFDQVDVVTEIDTLTSAWSLASGNYANRFSAAVAGAVARCAGKVAQKLKEIAADEFKCETEEIELVDGYARLKSPRNRSIRVGRLAARAHWDPTGLPERIEPGIYETAIFSPRKLTAPDEQDRVSSSVTYGSVFDLAAVEIDPVSGRVTIDTYVSVHDVGNLLNPLIVEGQIWGGFVHGFGGAMMEEVAYDANGNLLSGTFADYPCPTAPEIPKIKIGHIATPSPHTDLGCKGMGDGSSMLTPAALANAVSDALGVREVEPPLTLYRVWQYANNLRPEPTTARKHQPAAQTGPAQPDLPPGSLTGEGKVIIAADPGAVWDMLLDPVELAAVIPGCEKLEATGPDAYSATVKIGVAAVRGTYNVTIGLFDKQQPARVRLVGQAAGVLGHGGGQGWVYLKDLGNNQTELAYRYSADVGGKIASVGQRVLKTVTNVLIAQFFQSFDRRLKGDGGSQSVLDRLRILFTALASVIHGFSGGSSR